jgi:primosomal protein N'
MKRLEMRNGSVVDADGPVECPACGATRRPFLTCPECSDAPLVDQRRDADGA